MRRPPLPAAERGKGKRVVARDRRDGRFPSASTANGPAVVEWEESAFFNINTPADLAMAEARLELER
jgi:hypothetical protein